MNIQQECILSLLKSNDIVPVYMDPHEIGSVTYYFGGLGGMSLKFTGSCVPRAVAMAYLKLFSLEQLVHQIETEECHCNW